jgi:hypothetical protein
VNAFPTIFLSRSCRGGSIEIICSRWMSSGTPMSSTRKMPRRSEEKVWKSRLLIDQLTWFWERAVG